MIDTEKLNEKISGSGLDTGDIAKRMGIPESVLFKKINNQKSILASEVYDLCDILGITSNEEKVQIFFDLEV